MLTKFERDSLDRMYWEGWMGRPCPVNVVLGSLMERMWMAGRYARLMADGKV